jgi:hypothetical protein
MHRIVRCLSLSVLSLAVGVAQTSQGQNQSDEPTLLKLQREWTEHPGITEADITFDKSIMSDHFIQNDGFRNVYYLTPTEWETGARALRQANPNAKARVDLRDITVHLFGDTAIVTYTGTYTTSGYKDSRYNYILKFASADTWQKQAGQWKILADWNTPTEPIRPELYNLPPLPGMNSVSTQTDKR